METTSIPGNEVYDVRGRKVKVYLCRIICSRTPVNLKSREQVYSYIMHFEFEITALGAELQRPKNKAAAIS